MKLKEYIKKEKIVLLDGAMGTAVMERYPDNFDALELFNFSHEKLIKQIHTSYIAAGSKIINANTFSANRYKLEKTDYTVAQVVEKAVALARQAGDCFVALDIGPLGVLPEPLGDISFDELYEAFSEIIKAGVKAKVDLIYFETFSDLLELKAGVLAAKENSDLPIFATMSFEPNGKTFVGVSPSSAAVTMQALGVDAFGLNCSSGPDKMAPIVAEIARCIDIPVIAKANAGMPEFVDGKSVYTMGAREFSCHVNELIKCGASFIGGCCGTNAEYISQLNEMIKSLDIKNDTAKSLDMQANDTAKSLDMQANDTAKSLDMQANDIAKSLDDKDLKPITSFIGSKYTALASPSKVCFVGDGLSIIGERLNPTGKPALKKALIDGDMEYLLDEAKAQIYAGAHILDINAGLFELDEALTLTNIVRTFNGIIDAPFCLDSSNAEALEKAVRYVNGLPLINSLNGKTESLEAILPIVKKYGVPVICLLIDEKGVPKTLEQRISIAKKILEYAKKFGIQKNKLIFDCLALTVSAEQEKAADTLKAVKIISHEFGCNTVLGLSNISYGLPMRSKVNAVFLSHALASGLSAAILNPSCQDVMLAKDVYDVLYDMDKGAKNFISKYRDISEQATGADKSVKAGQLTAGQKISKAEQSALAQTTSIDTQSPSKNLPLLVEAIVKGRCQATSALTRQELEKTSGLEVINKILIPALDVCGEMYEKGEIYLPELLLSANAAKAAFDVVRSISETQAKSQGTVLLATVFGDVHDIGKNIAKMLLENYGYDVLDLGKDVPINTILDTMKKNKIKLVGLSALMTTTLMNMKQTIAEIKKISDAKVMVGGAVLTLENSKLIGADYYCKDALDGVGVARKLFDA